MNEQQRKALDWMLTTPPSDCEEDGHHWVFLGRDEEGFAYHKCSRCQRESE